MAKSWRKKMTDFTHLMEVCLESAPRNGTVIVERVLDTNGERKDST